MSSRICCYINARSSSARFALVIFALFVSVWVRRESLYEGIIPRDLLYLTEFSFIFSPRDQESLYTEKMQTLQQTLVEERDKIVQNANQQRSMLEDSLHSTKSEEQRLRTKLAEAEEVGLLVLVFSVAWIKTATTTTNHLILPDLQGKKKTA